MESNQCHAYSYGPGLTVSLSRFSAKSSQPVSQLPALIARAWCCAKYTKNPPQKNSISSLKELLSHLYVVPEERGVSVYVCV